MKFSYRLRQNVLPASPPSRSAHSFKDAHLRRDQLVSRGERAEAAGSLRREDALCCTCFAVALAKRPHRGRPVANGKAQTRQ